jgi:ABC-type spermidine/putrescine transport system permease subunit I
MKEIILLFVLPYILIFPLFMYTEYTKLKENDNLENYKKFVDYMSDIVIYSLSVFLVQIAIYLILK